LREAIAAVLAQQGKTEWAAQEFDYLRTFTAPPTRRDRWRSTSGIHKVRDRRGLAAVRELWTVRDHIAQNRDIATGRILPDSAIIDAAVAAPETVDDLVKLKVFSGRKQRRSADTWLKALQAARETAEPPKAAEPQTAPPPAVRWSKQKPEAAERLDAARAVLAELSAQVSVPTENLVAPELVRRLCWDWDPQLAESADAAAAIEEFLQDAGARSWQRQLAVPMLTAALAPARHQ
jgi:ribonuclease D